VILLDSSFLIAYHNTGDIHHAAAARAMAPLVAGRWGRAVLLEYVFLEVVTVFLLRRGPDAALQVGSTLLGAREIDFEPCSDHFVETLATFRMQEAEWLSFVDAAIVAAARRGPGRVVATFDRGFRGLEGVTIVPE
jgi:predicted nucleic acid-binding protein